MCCCAFISSGKLQMIEPRRTCVSSPTHGHMYHATTTTHLARENTDKRGAQHGVESLGFLESGSPMPNRGIALPPLV